MFYIGTTAAGNVPATGVTHTSREPLHPRLSLHGRLVPKTVSRATRGLSPRRRR